MAKTMIESINHLNYPDNRGRVYCRAYHEVRRLTPKHCYKCPMFSGSIQGAGVECVYPDLVSENNDMMAFPIPDPNQQLMYLSDLMDRKLLPIEWEVSDKE